VLTDEVLLKLESKCRLLISLMLIRIRQATSFHSHQDRMYEFFCNKLHTFLFNFNCRQLTWYLLRHVHREFLLLELTAVDRADAINQIERSENCIVSITA